MQRVTKKMILFLTIFTMILLLLFTGIRYNNRYRIQRHISEKVLRFHVLANSDSADDQALKYKVRDAIGASLQEKMKTADNRSSCEQLLSEELDEIQKTAERVILEAGYDYSVEAVIKTVDFPVKSYGAYTFPAGSYEALQVTIGAGQGHNWWCVMYPNMCFSGSVYEEIDGRAEEALREVLDEEEYNAVLKSGNYKVKFKYLTFLNQLME